jgi:hypothetical protein
MVISYIAKKLEILQKKTSNWYRNPCPVDIPTITPVATRTASTQTPSSVEMINADIHAVATGVDNVVNASRKGRVRKPSDAPRVAKVVVAKKPKAPKTPRNPFRRSETGKLQLKRLQMTKRVETMSPRVDVLRERLKTMQERMDFVSGKLTLVVQELTSRANFGTAVGTLENADEMMEDDLGVGTSSSAGEVDDEDIDLDDEVVNVSERDCSPDGGVLEVHIGGGV